MKDFSTPALLDGALGTSLIRAGMPSGACPEAWILSEEKNTALVQKLQADYLSAGARILYTPTFGANSAVLMGHSLSHRTAEINRRLAAATRETVEKTAPGARVFGDLSPTGRFLAPLGDASFCELVDIYCEQIAALNEYCDGFVSETNLQLSDARAALFAAKRIAPEKPFFASFTLSSDTMTLGGTDVRAAALCLYSLGATAVGVNCSGGPETMQCAVGALSLYRPRGGYILAKPNAGLPDSEGNFSLSPEEFAARCAELVALGADLVGGCCGTSPEYIRALSQALPERAPERAAACLETLLGSERAVFDTKELSFGEPVEVTADLLTQIDLGALAVHLHFPDEAAVRFAAEAFCYLPGAALCFSADSAAALSQALFCYQGRAAVKMGNLTRIEQMNIDTTYHPVVLKG